MPDYSQYSDGQLTSLLKESDHAAYTAIYERYFSLLYLHARRKVGDKEDARDLVQEVFVSLWNRREHIETRSEIIPYLYKALRNKIIDWMTHEQVNTRFVHYFAKFHESATSITDYRIREAQLREIIEREIAQLPPRMREIFELSRKHHLSHKEIADRLSISEQTVKTQVKNALRTLRIRLGLILYIVMLIKVK